MIYNIFDFIAVHILPVAKKFTNYLPPSNLGFTKLFSLDPKR
jgi:hypothetical protein